MSRLLNLPGTTTPAATEPGCRLRSGVREQDVLPAGSECGGQAVALSPGPWGVLSLQGCWVLLWALDRWQPRSCSGGSPGVRWDCSKAVSLLLGHLFPCPSSARWPGGGNSQPRLCVDSVGGQPSCWAAIGWARPLVPGLISRDRGRRRQSCPHCRPDAHRMRCGSCPHILPPGLMGSPAGQCEATVQPGKAWLCTRAGPQPGTGDAGDRHMGEQTGPRWVCLGGLP